MVRFLALIVLGLLASAWVAWAGGTAEPSWEEILGPPQAEWPAPQAVVEWRTDLQAAIQEADRSGRPLFVTLRCIPCKQCSEFDQDVLEGGLELDPLLGRFITVRLTDAKDLDLRMFPVEGFQDLDLSWWGWFFSSSAQLYGVYGGRDHVSDKTRISLASLIETLQRVLDHHYDSRRANWKLESAPPDLAGKAPTPLTLPGFKAWRKEHPEYNKQECLHCHQVAEVLRQPAIDAGLFQKQADFDMWPLPENVGLTLERDHGLLVTAVEAQSPASRAGLQAGDVLGAAAGRRLFSQADFRAVLHRGPRTPSTVDIVWMRGEELHSGQLVLAGDWRSTRLGWRKSVAEAAIGAHPAFGWPLAVNAAQRRQLGLQADALAVRPYFGRQKRGAAWKAGLRGHHVITAVNGESPNHAGREFMVWFRLRFEPGDDIELQVVGGDGKSSIIRYSLPK